MKQFMVGALTLALLVAGTTAQAATASSNLDHSVSIANECSISLLQHIGFGAYNPLAGTTPSAQGRVHVLCTKGKQNIKIDINGGLNASTYGVYKAGNSPGFNSYYCLRNMKAGDGSLLQYSVTGAGETYVGTEPAGTVVPGTSCTSSWTTLITVNDLEFIDTGYDFQIGATIPAGPKTARAGSYSDALVVRLQF